MPRRIPRQTRPQIPVNTAWAELIRNVNEGQYREQFDSLSDDLKQAFNDECTGRHVGSAHELVSIFNYVWSVHEARQSVESDFFWDTHLVRASELTVPHMEERIDALLGLMRENVEEVERIEPVSVYNTLEEMQADQPDTDEDDSEHDPESNSLTFTLPRGTIRRAVERQSMGRSILSDVYRTSHIASESERRPNNEHSRKEAEKQRREAKMLEGIVSELFPQPNFVDGMSGNDLDRICSDWHKNVQYRMNWIFDRREREGFNRRHIEYFGYVDMDKKLRMRKGGKHELDTDISKVYDWQLGGTDWILRLESVELNDETYLIVRHIHKPSNKEIRFDIRHWDGKRYKPYNNLWLNEENNERNVQDFFDDVRNRLEDYTYEEDEDIEFDDDDE